MSVRRFSDALAVADHIVAVEPANADAVGIKLYSFWALGNLEAADALVANPNVPPASRAYNALARRRYSEAADILTKVLKDEPDQEKDFFFALGLAQQRAGDLDGAKTTYQHAAQELKRQLEKAVPDSGPAADLHSNLGIAYAGLGDAASAVAEGQRAMALQPSSEDPFEGPEKEEAMARIYALLGDADHAIPILERLIRISSPTEITPGLLRLDPIWDLIRSDPRFQKLIAEKKGEPGR
jgi:tetratricopeptide (TPR) repeat protein